jgi:hypothetical protein
MAFLQDLQMALSHFITNAGDFVKADANALLADIDAQVAAGKLDQATATQEKQFPTNLIALVDQLEAAIGPIPAGAGPIYILSKLAKLSSPAAQQGIATQLKLVLGSGQSLLHLPGLPI